jgi:hypothetical protein
MAFLEINNEEEYPVGIYSIQKTDVYHIVGEVGTFGPKIGTETHPIINVGFGMSCQLRIDTL